MTAGRFGEFGGRFVPESLVPACAELEEAFRDAWADPAFRRELAYYSAVHAGRPTALTPAANLSAELGITLLLKREDLAHTGSHKINNVLGQALLARRRGKTRLIAETGAGQHGVATATAAALFGLRATIYMGARDIERQQLNVFRMNLLGAEVVPVTTGTRTLKDATNEALRQWVSAVDDTHFCLGSVTGPHPYPTMVRQFQRVIGDEARDQYAAFASSGSSTFADPSSSFAAAVAVPFSSAGAVPASSGGAMPASSGGAMPVPDVVVACVGGGSNAAGTFTAFADTRARLVGVEAAGGAAMTHGTPGVVHGTRSLVIQDDAGQIAEAHSIAAGLDYPGVGPEHAGWGTTGRVTYTTVTDAEVVAALTRLARTEGIICALESAHAVAWVLRAAGTPDLPHGSTVLLTLSGRGDKDMAQLADEMHLTHLAAGPSPTPATAAPASRLASAAPASAVRASAVPASAVLASAVLASAVPASAVPTSALFPGGPTGVPSSAAAAGASVGASVGAEARA